MKTRASSKQFVQNKARSSLLRWSIPLILLLGVAGLWFAWRASSQAAGSKTSVGVKIGDIAPDFTLPTLDGGRFTLSEQRGKPVIVFFMAYWCGSCIPEATALGKLQQEYGGRVSIVAVNIDPTGT